MADDMEQVNPDLEAALAEGGIPKAEKPKDGGEAYQPIYRVIGDSRIPVSKHMGKLWQSRRDTARQARNESETAWREAIRYYNNDQMDHRQSNVKGSGNRYVSKRMNDSWSETENVVFANVTALLPILYSKNPAPTITPTRQEHAMFASTCQQLLEKIANTREAPGINFKPKARRGVLTALLTNKAWVKVGYTFKEASSEQAMEDLMKLAKELEDAKDITEIRDIEGKIIALEKQIDLLTPEGPMAKVISPFNIIVDPESVEPDATDANWIMERDWLPTAYLKARYMQESTDGGYVSIYEPTHVLKLNGNPTNGVEEDVNHFTLALKGSDKDGSLFGYDDNAVYERAQMTEVFYVWDKTTRRVYMFHAEDWSWPIWVWNDPFNLLDFFPYSPLWFHETVDGANPKGEVTYYLDQQDAINEINDEERRARRWVKRNVFFKKNAGVTKEDVENVLKGPDGTARGIDVPEGMKLSDVIGTLPPPSMQFPQLFNTERKYVAINRITGIADIMRGGQFKTNTTNAQAQELTNFATVRVDEKTDLIEDWMGRTFWQLLQLCSQFMTQELVAQMLGNELAEHWQNLKPQELRAQCSMTIVGGSTDKPTSARKKQEALELGQVLGQFVKASPAVVLVMLRVFEKAFDEVVIKPEDWEFIQQAMQASLNQAGNGPGDAQQGQAADPRQQIAQMLQQLPPEQKQKIEQLVQQGMDPRQAIKQVVGE